jgi:hypothetical protein
MIAIEENRDPTKDQCCVETGALALLRPNSASPLLSPYQRCCFPVSAMLLVFYTPPLVIARLLGRFARDGPLAHCRT